MKYSYKLINNNFVIDFRVPGISPVDLEVFYTADQVLSVDGTEVRLAREFDLSKATAEYRYGILTVTVPRFERIAIPVVDLGSKTP